MATEKRCRTRLLADAPAETDAFGSHERVAGSIAEVVQTESGGRSIGLEGGWGAGKSTIVKLTSKKLTQWKGHDHRVAVFDIWAHQDDPLRRTFLENLITRVQEFDWVNKEKWYRRLTELTRRRREDTTRVVPKLTGAGVVFVLTLLAIPVGSALISAGATLLASENAPGKLAAALLPIGLVGVLAPAIYYCLMWGARRWGRKSRGEGDDEDGGLNELPALVTGQASTESRSIVTQTPDPTSVEFESVFRDLLGEALEPESRRLLLVLDNLDRVQPSDALSIWSTLQTFLGYSDYRRANWIDRLWVLIPFDGDAILRLWDRPSSDATESTNSAWATSFLDKTFQLRFRVPPLLLSNWRGFLQESLKQALPDHQEADFHDVYRVFAAKGGLERSAPTPRDLKIFVNQIGGLHREWQDEFPLSHLACYVLLQKDGADVRKALLSNEDWEFLSQNIGQQWRETIAALHFGVPAQEASQLLLRGPIQVALAKGDGTTLSELATAHSSGFWAVLEDSLLAGAQDWNSLTAADLTKAATALAESRVFDQADGRPEATVLRSRIQSAAIQVQTWTPFNTATAQGMVAVGQIVGNSDGVIRALLVGASNAPVRAPEEEEQGGSSAERQRVSPSAWMNSALTLIEGLVRIGLGKQIEDGIRVPLSAQQWIDVSPDVAKRDPGGQLLQYCHLLAIEEIDQLLAHQVVPGRIDDDTVNAVHTTMATKSRRVTNVSNAVSERLQSGETVQADQLVFMLKVLRYCKEADLIAKDQYEQFSNSGHYLHHLYQAASENHSEAIGECIFGYLEAVPDGGKPAAIGNSDAGHEILTEHLQNPDTVGGVVEHFIARVEETLQLSVVFEMATGKRRVPPFLARVLGALLISEDISKPIELVRANWSLIRNVLEREKEDSQGFQTFLMGLPGLDRLVSDVVDGTFDVREIGLYVALLKNNANANLLTWCANGIAPVGRDIWAKEIKSQGDLVDLVIELKTRKAKMTLGVAYFDGLIEYAKSVSAGQRRVLPDQSWQDLLTLLNADRKELLRRRVYELLEESDGKASAKFFDFFGDMISNRNFLAKEPRFIDQVCRPILDAGNAEGLAWVADIAGSHPAILTRHGDQAAANDFKERVGHRLNELTDEDPTLPHLKRIGIVLGIQRVDHKESDAESEARPEDMGEDNE